MAITRIDSGASRPGDRGSRCPIDAGGLSAVGWKLRGACASFFDPDPGGLAASTQSGSQSGSFFLGLAVLPPQLEWHKQLILLAIGIVQLLESKLVSQFPKRGVFYVIPLKILLATLLIDHTGEVGINSSYYPIYYLPVVTAALYCGPWLTLVWTLLPPLLTARISILRCRNTN